MEHVITVHGDKDWHSLYIANETTKQTAEGDSWLIFQSLSSSLVDEYKYNGYIYIYLYHWLK